MERESHSQVHEVEAEGGDTDMGAGAGVVGERGGGSKKYIAETQKRAHRRS